LYHEKTGVYFVNLFNEGVVLVMRAVVFDGKLTVVKDYPMPDVPPGWALIRVKVAGICGTDIELIKGYKEFKGVLGHEFIGTVETCDDPDWIGKPVAGEINTGCGRCGWCENDLQRHCPDRSVLGILKHDGCMADYCVLPMRNLFEIPNNLSSQRAIFIEPVSAACEMLQQVQINGTERAIVLGDGRLGILCAWVLATVLSDVTLMGHHAKKLARARWRHLKTERHSADIAPTADIVVDATGTNAGIRDAIARCRPRGTIVLKTTVAAYGDIDLSSIVINELTVVGSRCGQFKDGLRMLASHADMPLEGLITAQYPMEQAVAAFEHAVRPEALKVLIDMNPL
jgi:alcohol dehydrogenase